jgi:inner membrane protein
MDNLTHTATGLFLARSGLGRDVPYAGWILVLAANIPDLDVISAAGGPLTYLSYHRHLTHSLPLMPVMALLAVLAVRAVVRKRLPWMRAYGIALVGVASHIALDLTNIYGIRLLLPFSGEWFRLDLTGVVDLWIWAVFLIALVGPVLARLVNSEIGARRGSPARGFAIFALLFLLFYNGTRSVLHARAVSILDARLYDGAAPLRLAALPSPANPLRWRGLVETPGFYAVHDVNLLGDKRSILAYILTPFTRLQENAFRE